MFENNLLISTVIFYFFSYFILRKEIGSKNSIYICIIKFSIPLVWLYMNDFECLLLSDEISYYVKSKQIYEGILSNGLIALLNFNQYTHSSHFLFYMWNAFLFLIFGKSFYISIMANVFLSCVSGRILLKILRHIGVESKDSKIITVFYLLSPSVICWSSFHNLREIFLSVFLFLVLLQMMRFYEKQSLKNLFLLLISFLAMFPIRFYIIIIATLTLSISLLKKKTSKILFLFIISSIFLSWGLVDLFAPSIKNLKMDFLNIAYGFIRFILTPNPLNLDQKYYFIFPDAIFHTIMFPIFLVGIISVYRKYKLENGMIIIFLFVFLLVVFYAILPQVQGPRQRFPLSFFFIFCQYEGLLYITEKIKKIAKNRL